jgi:hypothetical protein
MCHIDKIKENKTGYDLIKEKKQLETDDKGWVLQLVGWVDSKLLTIKKGSLL